MFKRKSKIISALKSAFGKIKDEDFEFSMIEKYHTGKPDDLNTFQRLSDQVWNDLDMDLFFYFIDRTNSKVGQQYLYHKIKNIELNQDFDAYERIISALEKDENLRLHIQFWLQKLNHKNAYHLPNLFLGKHLSKPTFFSLAVVLCFSSILTIFLGFFTPKILIVLIFLFPVNAVIHYLNKKNVHTYIYSIPLLLTLNKVAKKMLKIDGLASISQGIQPSVKIIDKVKRRIAVFKLEQKIESDLEIIYWFLLEIIKILFLLEPLLLFSVVDRLKKNKKEIETIFEYIGKLDLIISIISLRRSAQVFCIPGISPSGKHLDFKNITHPLVPNCVSNSSVISDRSYLITGSNMSGKTTFIRAIGLSYISGLVLNTSFASTFNTSLFQIHTLIRTTDDISNASSYFFQEINSMKSIIDNCAENIAQIVLLDELFKGTNTKERIAAAKAVLSYLHKKGCLVFAATHDLELTELLEEMYDLYYFSESISAEGFLTFDYCLKRGVMTDGNAISILRLNDYPLEIIADANKTLKDL